MIYVTSISKLRTLGDWRHDFVDAVGEGSGDGFFICSRTFPTLFHLTLRVQSPVVFLDTWKGGNLFVHSLVSRR